MSKLGNATTYTLGDRTVKRMGFGAMQLAGPGVFGPPKDREGALAVLRAAIESGLNHIDTSDFYGPHVTNQLIREALLPYPDDLAIVTKGSHWRLDRSFSRPMAVEHESQVDDVERVKAEVAKISSIAFPAAPERRPGSPFLRGLE